ncbi:hypothetical protein EGH44_25230 [Klebsiella aerogenes]|nr:hypothetical protein B9031_025645 [Klebsiella aerogenes]RSW42368.1 hypothetical protein EGH44_25230 [Klebsiella aerogenes]
MKIIGVFAFLVPGRHLIRTSSLPPYGVASQEFVKTINNLAPNEKTIKNVKSLHPEHHVQKVHVRVRSQ